MMRFAKACVFLLLCLALGGEEACSAPDSDESAIRKALKSLAAELEWPEEVLSAPPGEWLPAWLFGVAEVPFSRIGATPEKKIAYVYLCRDGEEAKKVQQSYIDDQSDTGFIREELELEGYPAVSLFTRIYTPLPGYRMNLSASIHTVIIRFDRYILIAREERSGSDADALGVMLKLYQILANDGLAPKKLGSTRPPSRNRSMKHLSEQIQLEDLVPSGESLGEEVRKWRKQEVSGLEAASGDRAGLIVKYLEETGLVEFRGGRITLRIEGFPMSGGAKARLTEEISGLQSDERLLVVPMQGIGSTAYRIDVKDPPEAGISKIDFVRNNLYLSTMVESRESEFDVYEELLRFCVLLEASIQEEMGEDAGLRQQMQNEE